jgi:hypothetical protein
MEPELEFLGGPDCILLILDSVESVDGVKKRWSKHEVDFRNTFSKHNTRLSTYIWKLKEEGKIYDQVG